MVDLSFQPTLADRLSFRKIRNSLPKSLRSQFESDVAGVMKIERPYLTDQITCGQILFAACVLCAHKSWVGAGFSEDMARDKVTDTITQIGRNSMKVIMKLSVWFSSDNMTLIRRASSRKPAQYGPSFKFAERDLDNSGFAFDVHVCGYRTFLMRHNAVHLLSSFCAWDKVWIDHLPKDIRFSLPTTLAKGGQACKFEFRRTE